MAMTEYQMRQGVPFSMHRAPVGAETGSSCVCVCSFRSQVPLHPWPKRDDLQSWRNVVSTDQTRNLARTIRPTLKREQQTNDQSQTLRAKERKARRPWSAVTVIKVILSQLTVKCQESLSAADTLPDPISWLMKMIQPPCTLVLERWLESKVLSTRRAWRENCNKTLSHLLYDLLIALCSKNKEKFVRKWAHGNKDNYYSLLTCRGIRLECHVTFM